MATIGISFGRFNPPHQGHFNLWHKMIHECDAAYISFNYNTHDKKNPLPGIVKHSVILSIAPHLWSYIHPASNVFELVTHLHDKGYQNSNLKVYSDEDWITTALLLYNGDEGAHGFFKFKSIEHVQTPRITSATSVREAVLANDKLAFSAAAKIDADTQIRINTGYIKFFELMREHMIT